jgi:hypothetical protein
MANETELENLLVRLTGDAAQYMGMLQEAMQKTAEATQGIKTQMEAIGKAVSAIPGIGQALALLGATIGSLKWLEGAREKSEQAELRMTQLATAIRMSGRDAQSVIADYQKFAAALADITTTSKGQTLEMLKQAQTAGLTDDMAKAAVKNAVAIAAAKGGEAEAYLHSTIALAKGNTHLVAHQLGLARSADEATRTAEIEKFLAASWEQARDAGATNDAEMQRLGRTFDDLKKNIGLLINSAITPFLPLLRRLSDWFKDLVKSVDWKGWAESIVRAFVWVEAVFSHFGDISSFIWTGLKLQVVTWYNDLEHYVHKAKALFDWLGDAIKSGDFSKSLKMPEREIGKLELELSQKYIELAKKTDASMAVYVEQRVKELLGDRKKAEDAALAVGKGIGDSLEKGAKGGRSESRLEAALFGSAEAISRIQANQGLGSTAGPKPDANTPILKEISKKVDKMVENTNPSPRDTEYSGEGGDF